MTFNWTLMQSSGEGTLLDLSGIQSIDAGFNSSGNDNDYQKINALDGSVIECPSGLFSFGTPIQPGVGKIYSQVAVNRQTDDY